MNRQLIHIIPNFIVVLLFVISNTGVAQTFNGFNKYIVTDFKKKEVEIKQGEIASNILKVYNDGDKSERIYLELSYPDGWKSLSIIGKVYEVPPKDTLFIPGSVIPSGVINGNTKFIITAIVFSEDGYQLTNSSYMVSTKKIIQWDIQPTTSKKNYFLNGENDKKFGLNIFNEGNYDQDILMSLKEVRDDILIMDTNSKILQRTNFSISLDPWQDSTLEFRVKYLQGKRNFRKVDLDSHTPGTIKGEKRFSVIAESTEPKSSSATRRFTKNAKIDFIKLSNEKNLNGLGGNVLPLTVEANINGLFQDFTVMNLSMRGFKQFEDNSFLVYSANLFYSRNYYSPNFLNNAQGFLGYYFDQGNVQIGNVNGGTAGASNSGRGIKGEYYLNKKHTVGGYFVRSPNIFSNAIRTSFGATHEYKFNENRKINSFVASSIRNNENLMTTAAGSRTAFTFKDKHNISVSLVGSVRDEKDENQEVNQAFGFSSRVSYSSHFLDKKLTTNSSVSYFSPKFGEANNERLFINLRNTLLLKNNWKLNFNNSFSENRILPAADGTGANFSTTTITNQVMVNNFQKLGRLQPGIFYNIENQPVSLLHRRGISVRYGDFSMKQNLRYSANIALGYNRDIRDPDLSDYFVFQSSLLFNYRNLSLNNFYTFGPTSASAQRSLKENNINPQVFRSSLQHQYLFKNDHFLLQSSVNYNYYSAFKQHSVGLYPTLFFFTDSGWRINSTIGYNLSKSDYSNILQNTNSELISNGTTSTTNWNFNLGVKKDFGIPIPWMQSDKHNAEFIVFMDLNGNNIMDQDEIPLENVVIHVDKHEIITNEEGKANLNNIMVGNHLFFSFSLENLNGWFPKSSDSLSIDHSGVYYLPYIRGVKVEGQIIVNRDRISRATTKELDLTNIKISATSQNEDEGEKDKVYETLTSLDGSFQIYLPYGKYEISMDEGILGSKYRLLENQIELDLDQSIENIHTTFYVMEKKRKLNIKKF